MIGEIGPEDAERVYMAGRHLDSVVAGPGLNDNGSGVAAVLEVAEQLATRPLANGAALRVGFWGAGGDRPRRLAPLRREAGRAERRRIRAYVNLDMVGSPGEKAAVYAGSGERGRAIETALREGLPPGAPEERLGGASDHASFAGFDIPVGGIFTGLDRCYHRACDLGNVDPRAGRFGGSGHGWRACRVGGGIGRTSMAAGWGRGCAGAQVSLERWITRSEAELSTARAARRR